MTTEHGILYSDEMVRAKLDGRKTVTRRVIKPQPTEHGLQWIEPDGFGMWRDPGLNFDEYSDDGGPSQRLCPYGKPGDLLYGREAWRLLLAENVSFGEDCINYRADGEFVAIRDTMTSAKQWARYYKSSEQWRPSVHMPKCYSRIWDEIIDVRPERLWDITDEDIKAEGVLADKESVWDVWDGIHLKKAYMHLWDSLSARHPWSSNPWVWRIETKEAER